MRKILFLTGREMGYPRNDVLLRAFRRFCDVDAVGIDHRPRSLIRNSLRISLLAAPRLLRRSYDLVFVGFYGHLLMLMLGSFTRRPILFDAFVSTYDTLIEDRHFGGENSLVAWAAKQLDRAACRLAERIMLDTQMHVEYFIEQFHLPKEKFVSCPVGCDQDIFYPRPKSVFPPNRHTRVLYYSSYLPLHGVETIVHAAALLRSEPLLFRLIGTGQTYPAVRRLATQYGLDNIEFLPEIPLELLPQEIANADICLGGHFGASAKAGRVVPGKIYQMLAMAAPIIASNSPANWALLRHKESAYLCPPDNPQALAEAILYLSTHNELRRYLAQGGYKVYLERYSETVITDLLSQIIQDMLPR